MRDVVSDVKNKDISQNTAPKRTNKEEKTKTLPKHGQLPQGKVM